MKHPTSAERPTHWMTSILTQKMCSWASQDINHGWQHQLPTVCNLTKHDKLVHRRSIFARSLPDVHTSLKLQRSRYGVVWQPY
jgi:hypothetical protein